MRKKVEGEGYGRRWRLKNTEEEVSWSQQQLPAAELSA